VSDTGLRAFQVPSTSAPSVVDVPDPQSVTSQGPTVSDTGSRAVTVPGTPTTSLDAETQSATSPSPSVSTTDLRAVPVPGTSAPSEVVVLDTQRVTSRGPSLSDTGPRAATVPRTLLPSASAGPVTWCDSFSGTGKVWYGRRGPIGHLYASFDGGFRPLSDRCVFAWCVCLATIASFIGRPPRSWTRTPITSWRLKDLSRASAGSSLSCRFTGWIFMAILVWSSLKRCASLRAGHPIWRE
jgi:hypothetical protein